MRNLLLPFCLVLLPIASALAGDQPPEGSRPASEVARAAIALDIGDLLEFEFDDGHWEVTFHSDGKEIELKLDPVTLKEIQRETRPVSARVHPAISKKALPELLAEAERQLKAVIFEVEFDDGRWKIEFWEDGSEHKARIDPETGEIERR